MKIHEYQAKAILARQGVPVQPGVLVDDPAGIESALSVFGPADSENTLYIVKAQIHSGGRGKAGGVKLARSREAAVQLARAMLGSRIVTRQNGPDGQIVRKVLVAEGVPILKEYYLSLVNDPESMQILLIASAGGGTEIEELARDNPQAILRLPISPEIGLRDYQAREAARRLGIDRALQGAFIDIVRRLYRIVCDTDATLLEINPLVDTGDGRLVAVDAKMDFDANALYRHPDIAALRDPDEEDPKEVEASKYSLSYVALKGSIGCMVNGAGLAMATMDMIHACGGEPANFLDVGGGTTADKVAGALRILLSDPQVKVILVNIFGGIARCDIIASGILEATRSVSLDRPMVVRLAGTNAEAGLRLLQESGLDIITADSLADAAAKSLAAASRG